LRAAAPWKPEHFFPATGADKSETTMARTLAHTTNDSGEVAESVLGRSTRVRGRIQGFGDLRVEGAVSGDVAVSGDLSVEEGASIKGDVQAAAVTIGGELTGDVTARGPIAIRATAKVAGNLGGTEVSLEEGASFEGRMDADFDMPI
jgi:cytoskeletal protein CcmA (bactofilin family)